jgi:1,2-diacylglycerol 3-beta-galactosyltransferase
MSKRILVPYFLGGAGHLSFALSVENAFKELKPDWDVRMYEPVAELPSPRLHKVFVDDWKRVLAAPRFIQSIGFALNRMLPKIGVKHVRTSVKKEMVAVKKFLDEYKPDAIIPTHWGAAHLFDAARKEYGLDIPIWCVFCEVGGAYPVVEGGADTYFSLTPEADESLMKIGVKKDNLHTIGFVVQPDLKEKLPTKQEARKELGLDPDKFTVLFSLGGEGLGRGMDFFKHYYKNGKNAQMIILTGRNKKLYNDILEQFPLVEGKPSLVPFGFLPSIKPVFAASDLLAGKCGTSFVTESLQTKLPLIIVHLAAPHEGHTRDYVVNNNFGWFLPKAKDFTAKVDELAGNPELYVKAVEPFYSGPSINGGIDIAKYTIEQLEKSGK